jgi:hypothetical protein
MHKEMLEFTVWKVEEHNRFYWLLLVNAFVLNVLITYVVEIVYGLFKEIIFQGKRI